MLKKVSVGWMLLSVCVACASKAPEAGKIVKAPAPTAVTPQAPAAPQVSVPKPTVEPVPVQKVSPEVEVSVDSPTLVIQKYTEELRTIVDPEAPKEKGKRDSDKEKRIADKVRQFFDFEGLAQMALGRHWNTITAAQRREYQDLFVALIEDSYLKKSRDIVGDYKIVYGHEEIKGNRSKVMSKVIRNDADVDIIYELHRNPKNWMIFNIVLDNVDLIRNYQTQFNRIIEQNSFNGLLAKMRKKRDEIDKETTF